MLGFSYWVVELEEAMEVGLEVWLEGAIEERILGDHVS